MTKNNFSQHQRIFLTQFFTFLGIASFALLSLSPILHAQDTGSTTSSDPVAIVDPAPEKDPYINPNPDIYPPLPIDDAVYHTITSSEKSQYKYKIDFRFDKQSGTLSYKGVIYLSNGCYNLESNNLNIKQRGGYIYSINLVLEVLTPSANAICPMNAPIGEFNGQGFINLGQFQPTNGNSWDTFFGQDSNYNIEIQPLEKFDIPEGSMTYNAVSKQLLYTGTVTLDSCSSIDETTAYTLPNGQIAFEISQHTEYPKYSPTVRLDCLSTRDVTVIIPLENITITPEQRLLGKDLFVFSRTSSVAIN